MRSLPFDLWMGWVMEIKVLKGSGRTTDSAGDVHLVQCLKGVAGCARSEMGVEELGVVVGQRKNLVGVHDGWKRRKETVQEADLALHGFGTKQNLAGLSLSLFLWAQTGSGGELSGGDGFLQALNTLFPSLELPEGG